MTATRDTRQALIIWEAVRVKNEFFHQMFVPQPGERIFSSNVCATAGRRNGFKREK
jgi:hypothetical protein